jgi:flavodoxin
MKTEIRYFTLSKKGNTVKLANAISEAIGKEALTVDNDLDEEVDVLFLVNAMYATSIAKEEKEFSKRNASKIKLLVNVNSSATGRSTFKVVKKNCDNLGIKISDKEYHTKASWINLNKDRPNEEDLNRLKEFAKEIVK